MKYDVSTFIGVVLCSSIVVQIILISLVCENGDDTCIIYTRTYHVTDQCNDEIGII